MFDVLGTEGASRPEAWHPVIRDVHAYWLSIHPAAGGLPGRQHVDPCAIPHLLPHLFLVDVERPPLRFRYRLVGTAFVELMGCDRTGCYLDEVHPGFHGEVRRHYVDAVEQRRPVYRKGRAIFSVEAKRFLGMERILVPIAANGTDVDMILGGIVYIPATARPAARQIIGAAHRSG